MAQTSNSLDKFFEKERVGGKQAGCMQIIGKVVNHPNKPSEIKYLEIHDGFVNCHPKSSEAKNIEQLLNTNRKLDILEHYSKKSMAVSS